jgi:hypothetical protein
VDLNSIKRKRNKMQIQTTFKGDLGMKRIIDFIPLVNDFYAFRSRYVITCKDEQIKKALRGPFGKNCDGIIRKTDIPSETDLHTQIKSHSVEKFECSDKTLYPYLVDDYFMENFSKSIVFFDKELMKHTTEDFYKEAKKKDSKFKHIIFMASYDHTWYSHDLKPMPRALRYNYIEAKIDNENYDLSGVLSTIKKRPDVKIISNGIIDIPWYNSEEDRTKQIEFVWYPTVRVYRNIYKKKLSKKRRMSYGLREIALEMDYLKIKRFKKKREEY